MPPRKKSTNMDKLEKKRIAEKKRQERIAQNPALLEAEVAKRHQKYLNRVAKKQIKPAKDLKGRAKIKQQKLWNLASKKYRKKKKKEKELNILTVNTPASNREPVIVAVPGSSLSSSQSGNLVVDGRKACGRKKLRREKTKTYRKLQETLRELGHAQKKANKFKQRYYRLLDSNSNKTLLTPRSKVRNLLKKHHFVSPEVKKKLIYGEVLDLQMGTCYKSLKSGKEKQVFRKIFCGSKVLKAYRQRSNAKHFLKYKSMTLETDLKKLVYERKCNKINDVISQKVTSFFECDENSRMCPGKRDTVTRKKIKKQKRFLNDSLINLHKKFVSANAVNPENKLSYARFCALRPFWVVPPNVNNRNTCACTIHANMFLLLTKLKLCKIIAFKSCNELIRELCCTRDDPDIQCMLRNCPLCANKVIPYNLTINIGDTASYSRWMLKKETRVISGKETDVHYTAKMNIASTIGDMMNVLEETFPKYMVHVANIKNQYATIGNLKKNLKENEVIVHIDFSENYGCKYAEEVQSVHFGAARQQVTLHTGIFYCKRLGTENVKPFSFCTLSESLRHDPAAIWAHLQPILKHILNEFPLINTIHFLSDSPSTQYRNKSNFFLLTHFLKTCFPSIVNATWNFTESGHGKGAPDGVGGTLKRTADRAVAQGSDIDNFSDLLSVLKENTRSILLINVTDSDIKTVGQMLDSVELVPFKGTMRVHQLTWASINPGYLSMRSLSCFDEKCGPGIICSHFKIGPGLWKPSATLTVDSDSASDFSENDDMPLSTLCNLRHEVSQDTSLKIGDWVVVEYNSVNYPGSIVDGPDSSKKFKIEAMEPVGRNFFKWPAKKDVHEYVIDDIIKKILPPIPCGTRASQFFFDPPF